MLVALSAIEPEQENPTNTTTKKSKKFLNYASSNQYAIVKYHSNDMILSYHSYAFTSVNSRQEDGPEGIFSYRRMTQPRGTMGQY